jgi:uncharacterized protein YidB (DUF937 family)
VNEAKKHPELQSSVVEFAKDRIGVSEREAASGIAELLPAVVDDLTPDGEVLSASKASKRLDALERSKPAKGS